MTHAIRALPGVVALALVTAGCGLPLDDPLPPAPTAAPDRPAGSVLLTAPAPADQLVQQLRDAITADGGTVAVVVDHAARAREAGVEVPPNTVVVGGPPAATVPLLQATQAAGAALPQSYLVRQEVAGSATVTYNGADYLAAVSGVIAPGAQDAVRDASNAVATRVTGAAGPLASALVGVTPAGQLITGTDAASVAVLTSRLTTAADTGTTSVAAEVDLAAGDPALRPTRVVLVNDPAAEAPLLRAAPSIGLDLPLRFVIWSDAENRTQIAYPDPRRLAARHGVPADDPAVAQLAADAARLVDTATRP
jgi:uncharacterized protein (DUF302 family)